MNKDLLEKGPPVPDIAKDKKSYQRYQELGGIINKKDYESALTRSKDTVSLKESLILQAENIAKFAEIELHNTENAIDKRIILYGILRSDVQPKNVQYHHQQMNDQRLFAEALRMLEDTDALDKLKNAYHTNRPLGTYCPLCGQTRSGESCP